MADQGAAGRIGFIFDCDGTLMDTIEAWHEVEDALLTENGIALTKAQRDHLSTLTLEEAGEFFYEEFDVLDSPQQVSDMIHQRLLGFYQDQALAKAGALAFLQALRQAGAPLAVLSSSPQEFLQAGLGRAAMLPLMDAVLSVDDLGLPKRDPEAYRVVCARLGTEPAATWFFDDSWYALEAARKAGLRTFGIHSSDKCGTHQELGRFAERVEDDFSGLGAGEFLPARR